METRVYEQLLDEAMRCVTRWKSLLSRFETAVTAESLKRLNNLGQDVADVLNTVQRLEARVVESTAPGQDSRLEADYRAAVAMKPCVDLGGLSYSPNANKVASDSIGSNVLMICCRSTFPLALRPRHSAMPA